MASKVTYPEITLYMTSTHTHCRYHVYVICTSEEVSGQNVCYGHYGSGGDEEELVDPELEWCCTSCNCQDLSDAEDCESDTEPESEGDMPFMYLKLLFFGCPMKCMHLWRSINTIYILRVGLYIIL